MKSNFKYMLAGIVLITITSCNDWLDLKPIDKMVLDNYWKKQEDVESTIRACYRSMQEDGFMERIILGGELRSDNVIVDKKFESSDDQLNISDVNIKPTNGLLTWKNFYTVINYCNTVLEYAPKVTELDPNYTQGFLRAHEAEARTIRALVYFYLVRIYRDVPYIDFSYSEDTQEFSIPKMDGDQILDIQINELLLAEKYALKAWATTNNQKGRITKNAVRALLADIYLWLGRYDECIEACNRILPDVLRDEEVLDPESSTGAELRLIDNRRNYINSFLSIFVDGNSMESIFELQFSQQIENKKIAELYGKDRKDGRLMASSVVSDLFLKDDLYKKDYRGFFSFVRNLSDKGEMVGFTRIFKYTGLGYVDMGSNRVSYVYLSSTNDMNWIFYRLADVYLMKAEALTERENPDLSEAFALVNLIYRRCNPEASPLQEAKYSTLEQMQELILGERHREFLFEGKRWFDLVRLARKEDMKDKESAITKDNHPKMLDYIVKKYQYNGDVVRSKLRYTDALYLPIAEKELISNKALKQNPYYEAGFNN